MYFKCQFPMDNYEVGFRFQFVRIPHLDLRPLLLMNDECSGSDIGASPYYISVNPLIINSCLKSAVNSQLSIAI